MNIEHDQHDDAVAKVLAALRDAAPPEGMEARIAQRLQQQAAASPVAPFRWRDMFANSAIAAAWWRGAVAGAAAVLLIAGAVLGTSHLLLTHPDRAMTARNSAADHSAAPAATLVGTSRYGAPANETGGEPCAHPAMLRTASVAPIHAAQVLRSNTYAESAGPSHPVPGGPLTAQERELVRLAHSVDPGLLATLNSAHQARLEAENAADFAKFFASPPQTPVPPDIPAVDPAANPEAKPEAKPEVNPPSNSESSPLLK